MGCKTSYEEKTRAENQPNNTSQPAESAGEKFRKQRENRFKYMENRPTLNIQVRKMESNRHEVSSPAVFMCPSKNALYNSSPN